MQSPCDRIFIKSGEASVGLREAQRQIQDWRMYISQNEPAFRGQLAELAKDLPAQCSNACIHQRAETELRDLKTVIRYRYMVLIGRRASLNIDMNQRRTLFGNIEIATFDRLLEDARRLDNTALF